MDTLSDFLIELTHFRFSKIWIFILSRFFESKLGSDYVCYLGRKRMTIFTKITNKYDHQSVIDTYDLNNNKKVISGTAMTIKRITDDDDSFDGYSPKEIVDILLDGDMIEGIIFKANMMSSIWIHRSITKMGIILGSITTTLIFILTAVWAFMSYSYIPKLLSIPIYTLTWFTLFAESDFREACKDSNINMYVEKDGEKIVDNIIVPNYTKYNYNSLSKPTFVVSGIEDGISVEYSVVYIPKKKMDKLLNKYTIDYIQDM